LSEDRDADAALVAELLHLHEAEALRLLEELRRRGAWKARRGPRR
jgi:hypothetical protein